jgi:hypothetical protein
VEAGNPIPRMANIDERDLKAFKRLAKIYLERSELEMDRLVRDGELVEIKASQAVDFVGKAKP